MCRICSEIVNKKHFDTEEHINKFNTVCKIKIEKSLKDSFLKIKCKFIDTRYNYIYTDLYFKKYIKEIILKILISINFTNLLLLKRTFWNSIMENERQHIFHINSILIIY